jgi:hypothetical protein
MAINISDVEPRVQYTATSGQTSFTVPFEFFVNEDLKVYNGTTLLTFNASPSSASQYSVTGAGVTGGGSITLGGSGATLNDIITISRDIAIARTTDFPTSGAFQIASLNEELDKIVAMCGQLERDLKFSPKAAATTSNTFDITFPNLEANKVLTVNSLGTGLEFSQSIGEYKGNWSASTSYVIRDIVKDTSTNNIFIANANHTSSGSQPLTTNTDSTKWDLLVDAASATTSATNAAASATTATTKASEAATSATNAATSETNAATSATTATTKASEAATSATNAATSETNAATSETNAATSATSAATSAAAAAASANFEVLGDTTPQLGGHLDTNEKEIQTVSNRNVILAPNGTGLVEIKGNDNAGQIQLNCEQNSHGVKIKGPPHSAGQSYTLTLPSSITNGYYLKTDGSGNLSFAEVPQPTVPTIEDVSQTIAPATATTINITGTNFSGIPIVQFIKSDTGAITSSNTVSLTNATTLAVNVTLASGSYYVRIELENGRAARSTNAILTASTAPTFSTGAGSLGTFAGNFSGTLATISASSDSTITFAETTSVLTGAGVTLNTSTGALTTSDFGASSTTPTTYTFTIRITDAESQTTTREFSITSSFGATGGGQFN